MQVPADPDATTPHKPVCLGLYHWPALRLTLPKLQFSHIKTPLNEIYETPTVNFTPSIGSQIGSQDSMMIKTWYLFLTWDTISSVKFWKNAF